MSAQPIPSYPPIASATVAGLVSAGAQTFAGVKTFAVFPSIPGLSGTNTGDVTLGAVGSSPNANGATLSGQAFNLQPASATQPGVMTTGAQTIAGAKTFSSALGVNANLTIDGSVIGNAGAASAIVSGYATVGGAASNYWYGSGSTAMGLWSNKTDGAGAVGCWVDTLNTFSTAGTKLFRISNNSAERFSFGKDGDVLQYGTDSSGSPGAATINKGCGVSAIASGATTVVVTNSLVTTTSQVFITWHGDLGVQTKAPWVTRASGSFTVNVQAAPGAAVAFSWEVRTLI